MNGRRRAESGLSEGLPISRRSPIHRSRPCLGHVAPLCLAAAAIASLPPSTARAQTAATVSVASSSTSFLSTSTHVVATVVPTARPQRPEGMVGGQPTAPVRRTQPASPRPGARLALFSKSHRSFVGVKSDGTITTLVKGLLEPTDKEEEFGVIVFGRWLVFYNVGTNRFLRIDPATGTVGTSPPNEGTTWTVTDNDLFTAVEYPEFQYAFYHPASGRYLKMVDPSKVGSMPQRFMQKASHPAIVPQLPDDWQYERLQVMEVTD